MFQILCERVHVDSLNFSANSSNDSGCLRRFLFILYPVHNDFSCSCFFFFCETRTLSVGTNSNTTFHDGRTVSCNCGCFVSIVFLNRCEGQCPSAHDASSETRSAHRGRSGDSDDLAVHCEQLPRDGVNCFKILFQMSVLFADLSSKEEIRCRFASGWSVSRSYKPHNVQLSLEYYCLEANAHFPQTCNVHPCDTSKILDGCNQFALQCSLAHLPFRWEADVDCLSDCWSPINLLYHAPVRLYCLCSKRVL